jgi:tetratricopeptide (TPR) repeat protein
MGGENRDVYWPDGRGSAIFVFDDTCRSMRPWSSMGPRHQQRSLLSTATRVGGATIGLLLAVAVSAGAREKPPRAQNQVAFGVDMAQRGLWSEALFRFRQAEKLGDNRASVLNNIAVAYEALGLFDQAQGYYKKALDQDPRNTGLKRNYSRFVEFYQSFKPDQPASPPVEEPAPAAGEATAPKDRAPGATEDEQPSASDPSAAPSDPS